MQSFRLLVADQRAAYRLVPWRMRFKLIAIAVGSFFIAVMDMVALMFIMPMMQLVSGASVSETPSLKFASELTGVTDRQTLVIAILVAIVVLMVGKNLATLAFRWWSLGIMARAQTDAAYSMLKMYTSSSWANHRRRSKDDIYQAMTAYVSSTFGITSDLILLVVDLMSVALLLLALLVVSPSATAVALVFFGGVALFLQAVLKKAQVRLGEEARIAGIRSWAHLRPSIDGFKEARLVGGTEAFVRDYAKTRRTAAFANRSIGILGEVPRYVLEIAMILGILVIAATLFMTTDERSALAFLAVFAVAAVRIAPALNRTVATLGRIRANSPNNRALREEMDQLQNEPDRKALSETPHDFPRADIQFQDVSFEFEDSSEPVLKSVSGVIPVGSTVAFVGTSGAGKTTFAEILMALFEPTAGKVTVDGVSIHDHPDSWRNQLGVVAQDVYILGRSVRENIVFGTPDDEVDENRLTKAIEMADLGHVIEQMPDGMDTILGEWGTRVSGGQKQRIGIARALYRDPQVLILDEATSALDNETEARITDTIKALQGKMTIIVIAHRLSTVKHADQIFFFSKGKIAGRGTMDELAASNEEFGRLVELGNLK